MNLMATLSISLLAEDVKARIKNDLEAAEMYSAMTDTSPRVQSFKCF